MSVELAQKAGFFPADYAPPAAKYTGVLLSIGQLKKQLPFKAIQTPEQLMRMLEHGRHTVSNKSYRLSEFRDPHSWSTPAERLAREAAAFANKKGPKADPVADLLDSWAILLEEERTGYLRGVGTMKPDEYEAEYAAISKKIKTAPWAKAAPYLPKGFDPAGLA